MREIKFRGKQKTDGVWIYGFYYTTQREYFILGNENPNGTVLLSYEVIPKTVGQYTGLEDKNGKRIYEGDIVRISCEGFEYLDKGFECAKVKWKEAYSAFVLFNNAWGEDDFIYEWSMEDLEVIGNIHDNPELLEADNGK